MILVQNSSPMTCELGPKSLADAESSEGLMETERSDVSLRGKR